jgi:hypothetical protein
MVRFTDAITIHEIEKYGSEKESSLFWWSEDEATAIVEHCQRIVSILQSTHFSSSSLDKAVLLLDKSNVNCSRGLEQFLPGAVAEQQRMVQSQAQKAILTAQAEQQKTRNS